MPRLTSLIQLVFTVLLSYGSTALAQDQAVSPSQLKDDYLIGRWTFSGTIGGNAVKGMLRVDTRAGDTCFVYNWTTRARDKEPVHATAIAGMDLQTGEWVEYNFESNRSHYVARYKPDPKFGDVGKLSGELTGIVEGKPCDGKITVDRKSRDHFFYIVESPHGGDWELDYRRVKEKAREKKE